MGWASIPSSKCVVSSVFLTPIPLAEDQHQDADPASLWDNGTLWCRIMNIIIVIIVVVGKKKENPTPHMKHRTAIRKWFHDYIHVHGLFWPACGIWTCVDVFCVLVLLPLQRIRNQNVCCHSDRPLCCHRCRTFTSGCRMFRMTAESFCTPVIIIIIIIISSFVVCTLLGLKMCSELLGIKVMLLMRKNCYFGKSTVLLKTPCKTGASELIF